MAIGSRMIPSGRRVSSARAHSGSRSVSATPSRPDGMPVAALGSVISVFVIVKPDEVEFHVGTDDR